MELGYALAKAGEHRILYVINTGFGDASEIMFNLRHRRWPIAYNLPRESTKDAIAEQRTTLAEDLRKAIKVAIDAEHALVEETIRRLDRWSLDVILTATPRGYFSVKNDGTMGGIFANMPLLMSVGRLLDLNVIWADYNLGGSDPAYAYHFTYLGRLVAAELQRRRSGNKPASSGPESGPSTFTIIA
jgi:hypothetical protein